MNNIFMNILIDKYKWRLKYINNQHQRICQIKHIQNNKSDDSENCIFAEGITVHQRLITTDIKINCFLICPEFIYNNESLELAEKFINKAQETFLISPELFKKISCRDSPDGFSSVVKIPEYDIEKLSLKKSAFVVVLDGLESPGNVGTIIRTCDGAAVDAVFICNKKARLTNPKLIKSSMGSLFTVPVVEFDKVSVCIKWLKNHNFSIYLTDTRATNSYKSFNYKGNTALIMGSERYGISSEWYSGNPVMISIPMFGICDSLNVGVAASIIVYEIRMKII